MAKRLAILVLAGLTGLVSAHPALADVKTGVDAWTRGDWNTAIAEWRAPAEAGDADALFNMGQAYRLGRGVTQNQITAEAYYLRAAQKGHIRAADTYGLLLFQDGRREAALPFVEDAADRGDPRAQYLIGIAHFNGDIVGKDWVRAYALVTLANGQGLPQAAPALAEMDRHIPLTQRQQAASLAVNLQQQADATRAREMATADLAMGESVQETGPQYTTPTAQPFNPPLRPAPVQTSSPRVPQPVAAAQVQPSTALGQPARPDPEREPAVLAARRAVREAMEATGTEDPGQAGADFARPTSSQQATGSTRPAPQASAPTRTEAAPAPAPARTQASGPWKLQLGAFAVKGSAERLWGSLQGQSQLAGKTAQFVPTGRLTRLLVGGYASRAEAQAVCTRLERSGQPCVVTR